MIFFSDLPFYLFLRDTLAIPPRRVYNIITTFNVAILFVSFHPLHSTPLDHDLSLLQQNYTRILYTRDCYNILSGINEV